MWASAAIEIASSARSGESVPGRNGKAFAGPFWAARAIFHSNRGPFAKKSRPAPMSFGSYAGFTREAACGRLDNRRTRCFH